MQVDLVVVSPPRRHPLCPCSTPHGTHLADAGSKLRRSAEYAERFGNRFVQSGDWPGQRDARSLDLLDPAVRAVVAEFTGDDASELYTSSVATDYQ
ncbi:MAG: hypothetical protein M5U19_11020 [Microthrixaceae bacterium]|nr:hypothetical protein [Microthrixaceae bacterium]